MKQAKKQQVLLLEDVDALGKKGEIANARPGYVRNFLFPQRLAMMVTENALRKQQRLREERVKQAAVDRKEADALAARIETVVLEKRVKVDPEGHMYGSVSAHDIEQLFQEQGFAVERKYIQLTRPLNDRRSQDPPEIERRRNGFVHPENSPGRCRVNRNGRRRSSPSFS